MTQSTHKLLLAGLGLALSGTLAVGQVTLALGSAYTINGGTLDQTGTDSDGAAYTLSGGGFRGVLFNLNSGVTLANSGDFIELNFSVVSFASNNNNPWAFRFGIFDNDGTAASANDQTSVTDGWLGFMAIYRTTNSNTNQTNNAIFQQGAGTGGLAGTTNVGGGFGGDPSNLAGTGITKVGTNFNSDFRTNEAAFDAVFRIERTATGLDITTLQSDTGTTVTRSIAAANVATYDFNSLAFAHSGNFTIDDIVVTTNIPEPPPTQRCWDCWHSDLWCIAAARVEEVLFSLQHLLIGIPPSACGWRVFCRTSPQNEGEGEALGRGYGRLASGAGAHGRWGEARCRES
ncbi:MAG: hypothetical protein LR015_10925 [Verrucomicrobia bacterium]|nr:hypothetical protein [Verrucomicrobiota bacterium]